jgi:hypothetical protein
MTTNSMISKFLMDGAGFLSELEGDDLWEYISHTPEYHTSQFVLAHPGTDFDEWVGVASELHDLVVAELKRERAADWDTWNNLLALDLEIKQEWIDELQNYEFEKWNGGAISSDTVENLLEYLRGRTWKNTKS